MLGEYTRLAQEQRTPAPLVPLLLPAILSGEKYTPVTLLTGARGIYELDFEHIADVNTSREHADALIVLQDLGSGSFASRRRELGISYTSSPTRVRGHSGLAVRGLFSPDRGLLWREDGRLYELATHTPRTISASRLRAVASGMQHLLGAYTAQLIAADGGAQEAEALLTDRMIDLNVTWDARCSLPGGEPPDRGAAASLGWLPLAGGAFSRSPFTVAGVPTGGPWTLALSGSASQAGGSVTLQASSMAGAESCAIGPLTLQLRRLPKLVKAT